MRKALRWNRSVNPVQSTKARAEWLAKDRLRLAIQATLIQSITFAMSSGPTMVCPSEFASCAFTRRVFDMRRRLGAEDVCHRRDASLQWKHCGRPQLSRIT